MTESHLFLDTIPTVLYGAPSDRVFLYIHGQGGAKEEAARFAAIAERFGYRTLAVDLPEHGARRDGKKLLPWIVIPELRTLLAYAKEHFRTVSLRTVSIGTWFSLLAFSGEPIDICLFSSPLLDMEDMILTLMHLAGVSEERLRAEGEIPTAFGQTLSWEYLTYVRQHPVRGLSKKTAILYATEDETIRRATVDRFTEANRADLCLYPGGEHWLHTPEEVAFMEAWEMRMLRAYEK
ncbi:MAG TPA: alpha/beta hydrolase [Clostridiales bacterium]|nr:alpha/beta hydrolase [Clostridiales bacterium]